MKTYLLMGLLQLFFFSIAAQNPVTIYVREENNTPLPGATLVIPQLNRSYVANDQGNVRISDLQQGSYQIFVSATGFEKIEKSIAILADSVVTIVLQPSEEEEEEVVVTATRLSRTIANIPTRVEVISGEELQEKGNMKPGEIRMLLSESTGIQVQQTSATSFNAGIRIQGLDGRYTQILKDGYPLYSGFSGGLSLLQTPPLDLRQVEVIKGSASTLYGGGAIAGLVNLVSKVPTEDRELNLIANATSAGGLDLSGFYADRFGKSGLTIFASRNSNKPYDPANIGVSAIPRFERYTINPRIFLYGKKTTADVGVSFITEDRIGGSMDYIKNGGAGFFEKNNTDRITTQIGVAHKINAHATLQLKNSYSRFNRLIGIPNYHFDAVQQSSFTELTWNKKGEKADWVAGVNFLTEDLDERIVDQDSSRDYHFKTYGLFVQHALSLSEKIVIESGIRGDFVQHYGFELLPRLSAMFRLSPKFTTRIGGGLGYKTPTIFTEETERIQFRNLLPIAVSNAKNERSTGVNWDVNFRTNIGNLSVNINNLLFYTRLNNPLILTNNAEGKMELNNSTGHLDTRGSETNLRLVYTDFKLFVGYTYTDANTHFDAAKNWLPLTAKHRLNNVLMWEKEDSWKLGLEAYYYGRQQLTDGSFSKPYWIMGFMTEKIWGRFSVYINFENFTDTRQSKFGPIYSGNISDPRFNDIYAPVEGFVTNGGIKLRL